MGNTRIVFSISDIVDASVSVLGSAYIITDIAVGVEFVRHA
jgi:hypothetical protein